MDNSELYDWKRYWIPIDKKEARINTTKEGFLRPPTKSYDYLSTLEELENKEIDKNLKTNELVDISNCDYIYGYSFMMKAEVYFRQNLIAEANELLKEGKDFCLRKQQFQPLSGMYLLEGKILYE